LSATAILLEDLPQPLARKLPRYPHLPAILLGRLAVDSTRRGRGYGELLLLDALRRGFEASDDIGALAVIVDAKDGGAASFYGQYGFEALPERADRLFLRMGQIERLFS
jgi:predicted GNAT family N-acyltransferase